MFEGFTQEAISSLMRARDESVRLNHPFVGTDSILLGLIGEKTGLAAKAFKSAGVSLSSARIEVKKIIAGGTGIVNDEISITPRAKRVLERACEAARQLGHNRIGSEHLLLGLLDESEDVRESTSVASKVLTALGVDQGTLKGELLDLINAIS